jgi:hypothetical protein
MPQQQALCAVALQKYASRTSSRQRAAPKSNTLNIFIALQQYCQNQKDETTLTSYIP